MPQSSAVQFRPARQADIPVLCDMLAELFIIEADFQPDREKQAQALRILIGNADTDHARSPGVVWVAEQAGKVIGMCSVQSLISTAEGGEVGLVEDVFIAAAHRGQGVGQQLLHSLESWARTRGLRRLQLLTDKHNSGALAFYERHGWNRTRMQALNKILKY